MNAACRLSEHLLYLTQSGRDVLGRGASQFARLNAILGLIEAADWHVNLPAQTIASQRCMEHQNSFARLLTLLQETQDLLKSAAELEPASEPRQRLNQAAGALGGAHSRLQQGASELNTLVAQSTILPSGNVFITSKIAESLYSTTTLLRDVAAELSQQAEHADQPGWANVVTALQQAAINATASSVRGGAIDPSMSAIDSTKSAHSLDRLAAEVEAMVQAQLLWAQNTLTQEQKQKPEASTPKMAEKANVDKTIAEEEEIEQQQQQQQQLPAAAESAGRTLGVAYLTNIADHGMAALSWLAN